MWCPNYRRKVLVDGVAEQLATIIGGVCQEHQAEVLSVEIMPDHVHLPGEVDPQFGIHGLVRLMKGRSSRLLRQAFPSLKTRMPTLWTHSYFVSALRTKSMSKQAYTCRLYPTRNQVQALTWTLDRCRELYNAALQERRDACRMAGKHITYDDQANQLRDIKAIREEYKDIHSQVLQDVLRKADKAFQAFFARCKRGATPGFPRYKGKGHFDSFTYPQGGSALENRKHQGQTASRDQGSHQNCYDQT